MISAELQAQLNHINCGAASSLGTGTNHCPFDRQRPIMGIFTRQGYEYEEALSNEYIQILQLRGVAEVITKMTGFEDLTADDNQTTEAGSNIITTSGKSPYTYAATTKNGLYNHKALTSMAGFGKWDATYVDAALNVLLTSTATVAKGFTLGQFDVNPYKGANGADAAFTRSWWQELYRYEMDQD